MRRRTIIAVIIAITLCFGVSTFWSAETNKRAGDAESNIMSDSGSEAGASVEKKKKEGNKIVKAITSPFRALRRLFGGRDEGKVQRLSEKDVERFESTGMTRVNDARTPAEPAAGMAGSAADHLAQGRALLATGRVNEAITELSMAVSLDPRMSQAHSLLGVAYDRKGMHDRAKEAYDRALGSDPQDAQTLNNLGFSLYQNGNYRAAVDKLKKAAKLAPTDQRILNNLALAQMRLGKYDDAYRNFARAGGEVTGRLNTASMLERMGRDEEAIKQYEALRRVQPNSAIALQRLADLYRRTGRATQPQSTRDTITAHAAGN